MSQGHEEREEFLDDDEVDDDDERRENEAHKTGRARTQNSDYGREFS